MRPSSFVLLMPTPLSVQMNYLLYGLRLLPSVAGGAALNTADVQWIMFLINEVLHDKDCTTIIPNFTLLCVGAIHVVHNFTSRGVHCISAGKGFS